MNYLVNNHLKQGYSSYNLLFLKKYSNELNLNNKILDLGCGHYRNLLLLYKIGFKDLYGVDVLTPRPIFNDKNFKVKFEKRDITLGLNYEDKKFDIVLLNFVLMFIPKEKLLFVISEALRVTRRYIIIEVQQQYYKSSNGFIQPYSFKKIYSWIENNDQFEIIDLKIYKEKLIARRRNG